MTLKAAAYINNYLKETLLCYFLSFYKCFCYLCFCKIFKSLVLQALPATPSFSLFSFRYNFGLDFTNEL